MTDNDEQTNKEKKLYNCKLTDIQVLASLSALYIINRVFSENYDDPDMNWEKSLISCFSMKRTEAKTLWD